jgi:hypothetical protein
MEEQEQIGHQKNHSSMFVCNLLGLGTSYDVGRLRGTGIIRDRAWRGGNFLLSFRDRGLLISKPAVSRVTGIGILMIKRLP